MYNYHNQYTTSITFNATLHHTVFFSFYNDGNTVMTLSFGTQRPGQMVQTQIRLLLEEQSDQGLHCLLFHLHHF